MTTTVEGVRRHLETDPALSDALRRDLVNLRRTARWLIAEHAWDATEEAVVSALRRYREDESGPIVWDGQDDLQETGLELRDGLALITLPRTPGLQQAVIEAWTGAGGTGPLAVLPGRTCTRLLVEETLVRQLTEAVGADNIETVTAPVAALRLILPEDADPSSLVSLVFRVLAHEGIDLMESVSCNPEWLLVFPADLILDAHRLTAALTRGQG